MKCDCCDKEMNLSELSPLADFVDFSGNQKYSYICPECNHVNTWTVYELKKECDEQHRTV
jgi:hypothetical protein